jgi:hypothetical protein
LQDEFQNIRQADLTAGVEVGLAQEKSQVRIELGARSEA